MFQNGNIQLFCPAYKSVVSCHPSDCRGSVIFFKHGGDGFSANRKQQITGYPSGSLIIDRDRSTAPYPAINCDNYGPMGCLGQKHHVPGLESDRYDQVISVRLFPRPLICQIIAAVQFDFRLEFLLTQNAFIFQRGKQTHQFLPGIVARPQDQHSGQGIQRVSLFNLWEDVTQIFRRAKYFTRCFGRDMPLFAFSVQNVRYRRRGYSAFCCNILHGCHDIASLFSASFLIIAKKPSRCKHLDGCISLYGYSSAQASPKEYHLW